MRLVLGIDLGTVRVGTAISDELQMLAHPLETIPARSNVTQRIRQIVHDRNVEKVVVGVPRTLSGEIGEAAKAAIAFTKKLRAFLPCDVVTWDERLTTAAAHRALRETGRTTRKTRGYIDQVAAQMILQGYLDRQQHGPEEIST
jgi:putative Holliday junction resolvase